MTITIIIYDPLHGRKEFTSSRDELSISSVLLVDCIKETSTTPWINGGKL